MNRYSELLLRLIYYARSAEISSLNIMNIRDLIIINHLINSLQVTVFVTIASRAISAMSSPIDFCCASLSPKRFLLRARNNGALEACR